MDSNLSVIPPYVHLFFDDDEGNIHDVQSVAKSKSINLQSVHCPPGPISFYDAEGTPLNQKITNYADYSALKQYDDTFSAHFKQFIKSTDRMSVGRGITPDMIGQIIAYESYEYEQPQSRLYFFDFDLLLSQLGGLDFSFVQNRDHVKSDFNDYAKYLFSDCIGEESSIGRLTLLKQMFSAIGRDRVYIITSNAFANPNSSNPFFKFFIGLTQVLLPSFYGDHLICTNSKIANPLFTKKSDAIMSVFNNVFKKSFMPLSSSASLPAASLPAASLPAASLPAASLPAASLPAASLPLRARHSARPPSALKHTIAKPKIKTTIYKKRKGGARRRSKFLHTRKKIRIT
jgi:hypothetical protein